MNRVLVAVRVWHQQFPVPVFNEVSNLGLYYGMLAFDSRIKPGN